MGSGNIYWIYKYDKAILKPPTYNSGLKKRKNIAINYFCTISCKLILAAFRQIAYDIRSLDSTFYRLFQNWEDLLFLNSLLRIIFNVEIQCVGVFLFCIYRDCVVFHIIHHMMEC